MAQDGRSDSDLRQFNKKVMLSIKPSVFESMIKAIQSTQRVICEFSPTEIPAAEKSSKPLQTAKRLRATVIFESRKHFTGKQRQNERPTVLQEPQHCSSVLKRKAWDTKHGHVMHSTGKKHCAGLDSGRTYYDLPSRTMAGSTDIGVQVPKPPPQAVRAECQESGIIAGSDIMLSAETKDFTASDIDKLHLYVTEYAFRVSQAVEDFISQSNILRAKQDRQRQELIELKRLLEKQQESWREWEEELQKPAQEISTEVTPVSCVENPTLDLHPDECFKFPSHNLHQISQQQSGHRSPKYIRPSERQHHPKCRRRLVF